LRLSDPDVGELQHEVVIVDASQLRLLLQEVFELDIDKVVEGVDVLLHQTP
jgi:hypothetical protein